MGARWRYSIWNGIVISFLAIFGAISCVLAFVPTEAMIGILLWIGLVMVVQSFRDVEPSHYYGVVFGLIPSLAAWALILIDTTARASGTNLYSLREKLIGQELFLDGVVALSQGFIISSSILASIVIFATERKYMVAGAWGIMAALLSWFGVIHGYELTESGVLYSLKWGSSPSFSIAYLLTSLMFISLACFSKSNPEKGINSLIS
jgi:AGZA family xanthine/uracil permease-like MFS transporter